MILFSFSNKTSAEAKAKIAADIITQYNPIGLAGIIELDNRYIYHKDTSPIWNGLYFQEGLGVTVTPAYLTGSVSLEWLPIAIFKLRLGYDASTYFGNYKLSFDSTSDFGDSIRKEYKGNEDTGSSNAALIQPTLQMKLGKVILVNQTDLTRYSFYGDGPNFLVNQYDLLVEKKDSIIANKLQVLYEVINENDKKILIMGPYYEFVRTDNTDLVSKRLGGILYYIPNDIIWGRKNPRLFIQSGVYLSDPNRKNGFFIIAGGGLDFGI